jgi:uncharacterized protein YjdB
MATKYILKIKRGNRAFLPLLQPGELGFAEDSGELFIGTSEGTNRLINPNEFDYDYERVLEILNLANSDEYDLLLFGGQSNMQGYPQLSAAEELQSSFSYEYFLGTDELAYIKHPSGEVITKIDPFTGSNFNATRPATASDERYVVNDVLIETPLPSKRGSSMVPWFSKFYELYGRKSISIHAAEGASAICEHTRLVDLEEIQFGEIIGGDVDAPDANVYDSYSVRSEYAGILAKSNAFNLKNLSSGNTALRDYARRAFRGQLRNDGIMEKVQGAIDKFTNDHPTKTIKNKIFFWNQGERDSDQMVLTDAPDASKQMYKENFLALFNQLKNEFGFNLAVIVRVGLWSGEQANSIIMAAQEELANENEDIIIGTRACGYFPHYTFNSELGYGVKTGYWATRTVPEKYEKTRDTYFIGGHSNRHMNDKANRIVSEVCAMNVYRTLYKSLPVILEAEPIEYVTDYLNLPSVPVSSVTLNNNSLDIEEGESATLIATVLPTDATNKTVIFESSNTDFVTVTSGGLVIGIAEGSATITVTTEDGDFTDTCVVNVTEATIPPEPTTDIIYIDFRTELSDMSNETVLPSGTSLTLSSAMEYDASVGGHKILKSGGTAGFNVTGALLSQRLTIGHDGAERTITVAFETKGSIYTCFWSAGEGVTATPNHWLGGTVDNFTGRFGPTGNSNYMRPNGMSVAAETEPQIYVFTFTLSETQPNNVNAKKYSRNISTNELTLVKEYNGGLDDWNWGSSYGNETVVIPEILIDRVMNTFSTTGPASTAFVTFFRIKEGTHTVEEMSPFQE